MTARFPESHQISEKQYVTLQYAARYLSTSRHWLENMILLEKIEAVQIESRQFIELQTLKRMPKSAP